MSQTFTEISENPMAVDNINVALGFLGVAVQIAALRDVELRLYGGSRRLVSVKIPKGEIEKIQAFLTEFHQGDAKLTPNLNITFSDGIGWIENEDGSTEIIFDHYNQQAVNTLKALNDMGIGVPVLRRREQMGWQFYSTFDMDSIGLHAVEPEKAQVQVGWNNDGDISDGGGFQW